MSKMDTEKKPTNRKTPPARLRTLSAQALEEVVGGTVYFQYEIHEVHIGGY